MPSKIQIFFSKLFSKIILENRIVATILYTVGKEVSSFKIKMEKTLDTDI